MIRPHPGSRTPLLVVLLAVLSVTCREASQVVRLATALNREFAGTRIGVSLTDGLILTVTIADSVLAGASCQKQVAVAMRVGRFLRDHDAGLDALQVVNVAFTSGREGARVPGRAAPLPIRFSAARVGVGVGASDSTTAVSSCAAYEDLNMRTSRPQSGQSKRRTVSSNR